MGRHAKHEGDTLLDATLAIASVDITYAAVRRHLGAHRPISAHTETLVEQCARAVLD
jgi:hypothetical protein